MLPLRHARRWRIASIVLLLLVLVATLIPAVWIWPDKRQFVAWFIEVDKWLHAITFVLLAIWFAGQYRRRSYWRIGIGLVLFGVLIEACQRLVTYRSAEWFDIVADAAGITVGLAVAMAGLGGWSLRLENWFASRRAGIRID
ncbi:MAG: VanZ family protein [Gammaproteobacteria bacterium]|jgi:VanZ family protein|nr:VanZ family protein [Gammaproteobacteria bacterium]MDH3749698.1 VanZ family protein [Gammaproteobacteria bacterium]MDH3805906.1 VanZ family protein [Gammaproteobacteria bacterium]